MKRNTGGNYRGVLPRLSLPFQLRGVGGHSFAHVWNLNLVERSRIVERQQEVVQNVRWLVSWGKLYGKYGVELHLSVKVSVNSLTAVSTQQCVLNQQGSLLGGLECQWFQWERLWWSISGNKEEGGVNANHQTWPTNKERVYYLSWNKIMSIVKPSSFVINLVGRTASPAVLITWWNTWNGMHRICIIGDKEGGTSQGTISVSVTCLLFLWPNFFFVNCFFSVNWV